METSPFHSKSRRPFWRILLLFTCSFSSLYGQNNLIRNHSFENKVPTRPNKHPEALVELDGYCRYWKSYGNTTSDWFKNAPDFVHGAIGCEKGLVYWSNLPMIPNGDGPHYAGAHDWVTDRGEGFQQRMKHKLRNKTYSFSFDYFIPCDTTEFAFDLFFGKTKNDTSYHVRFDTLDRQGAGQWHSYQFSFSVPPLHSNKYDWFVWLFTGNPPSGTPGVSDGSYLFVDNFHIDQSPLNCTNCDPTGLISWNDNSMRPYMTPNSDGVFDQWCMTNINNASWYEFEVFDRWGGTVYAENGSDPNGYENMSLCWDGRNNLSQMLNVPNEYQIRVRLGNCATQTTNLYQLYTSNDHAHDTFSVAQNYVPPLFGLHPAPTHFRELHLYGGPYYGTHDWYACNSIWLDDAGAPRVPYFRAASTSDLGFYATDGIYIDHADVDFEAGSDIDINPQPVACCPPLRLQNPDLSGGPLGDLDTVSELGLPVEVADINTKEAASDPIGIGLTKFELEVFPSPAKDVLRISFYLPDAGLVSVRLVNSAGVSISEVLDDVFLEAGSHAYSVSVKALPAGVYVLRLGMGEGLPRPESFREVVKFRKVVVLD